MKYFLQIVSAIVLIIVQTTIMPYVTILGIRPNLVLAYVVCIASICGMKNGLIIGTVCGIVFDIAAFSFFGFNSIYFLLCGLLLSFLCEEFFKVSTSLLVVEIFVVSLLYGLLVYMFNFMAKGQAGFLTYMLRIIVPEALYTTLLSWPIILITDKKVLNLRSKGMDYVNRL